MTQANQPVPGRGTASRFKRVAALMLFACVSSSSSAGAADRGSGVCDSLRRAAKAPDSHNRAQLFLIAPDGNLSKGPIDFGAREHVDDANFIFYVPTGYQVASASKWMRPQDSDLGGSLHLVPANSPCKGAVFFDVSLVSRRIPSGHADVVKDAPIELSNFHDADPEAEIDSVIVFRFDARMNGTIKSLSGAHRR